jgi:hypothetical protein
VPNFPANPVKLPDCQQNWEYLQKQLTANGGGVAFGTVVNLGVFTLSGLTLTFTNIPQTFNHLKVEFITQSQRPAASQTGMRFAHNSVVAAQWQLAITGHGNTGAAGVFVANDTRGYLGQSPALTRTSDNYTQQGTLEIPFYARTDAFHHFIANSMMDDGNTLFQTVQVGNTYRGDTNAVTSLRIFDDAGSNLGPRSRATLYGIV